MKRCPECHEYFSDEEGFCDIHGAPLLDDTVLLREALTHPTANSGNDLSGANSTLVPILLGGLVGIALCLLVYVILLPPLGPPRLGGEDGRASRQFANNKSNQMVMASSVESRPSSPAVAATVTPTKEEEAQSAASPSAAATVSPEVAPAALNNGPISTGGRRTTESVHPVIKMKDGSSVEADAAWEDSQGIWYRRGGLVSFVDRSRVEKIIEAIQQAPSVEIPKR
jgi:hypothetical protein